MPRARRATVLVLVLAACAGTLPARPPTRSEVRIAECNASAAARVPEWRALGVAEAEIARRQKLAAQACMGADTDSATAVFAGTVNVELRGLADMFMSGALTGSEHLARLRDRGRKLRRARANPGWAADWIAGDADGDLVPDSLDRCPATAALAPTNDKGCGQTPLPPSSPSDDELVRLVVGQMGVVGTRDCDGATIPDTPSPVSIVRSVAWMAPFAAVTVVPVENQPPGCLVLYELVFDTYWATGTSVGPHRYQHVVMRDFEGLVPRPGELTFVLQGNSPAGRGVAAANIQVGTGNRWRVRAVNGAGLASSWSGWLDSR